MSRNLQATICKTYFTSGVPILPSQTLDIVYFHSDLKILKKGKKHDINKGYFSLNDFWHSDASLAWRSKTPTSFYPLKKACNSRDGSYSFEVFPLHTSHALESLSEK